jgi:hypothetical protein
MAVRIEHVGSRFGPGWPAGTSSTFRSQYEPPKRSIQLRTRAWLAGFLREHPNIAEASGEFKRRASTMIRQAEDHPI